jgi:hypothetical protein
MTYVMFHPVDLAYAAVVNAYDFAALISSDL